MFLCLKKNCWGWRLVLSATLKTEKITAWFLSALWTRFAFNKWHCYSDFQSVLSLFYTLKRYMQKLYMLYASFYWLLVFFVVFFYFTFFLSSFCSSWIYHGSTIITLDILIPAVSHSSKRCPELQRC